MTGLDEALKIGAATGGAFFASSQIQVEGMSINIVSAVTVIVFVSSLVWWLSSKFQKIEDSLKGFNSRLDNLPCDECKPKHKTNNETDY